MSYICIQLMISYKNDKSYLPLNTNKIEGVRLRVMVLNTTFNTISVISLVVSFIGGGNRN